MGINNQIRRESSLHFELEPLSWTMENMFWYFTCQNFETNYKNLIAMILEPKTWPNILIELKEIEARQQRFHSFKIFLHF